MAKEPYGEELRLPVLEGRLPEVGGADVAPPGDRRVSVCRLLLVEDASSR